MAGMRPARAEQLDPLDKASVLDQLSIAEQNHQIGTVRIPIGKARDMNFQRPEMGPLESIRIFESHDSDTTRRVELRGLIDPVNTDKLYGIVRIEAKRSLGSLMLTELGAYRDDTAKPIGFIHPQGRTFWLPTTGEGTDQAMLEINGLNDRGDVRMANYGHVEGGEVEVYAAPNNGQDRLLNLPAGIWMPPPEHQWMQWALDN